MRDRAAWAVGVDFGGTNVKIGLVNPRGTVVRSTVLPTRSIAQPPVFVETVSRTIRLLARDAGFSLRALEGVGIGVPGLTDVTQGRIHTLINVPGWQGVRLGPKMTRALGRRCFVDNDVNVMLLGEWGAGAGAGSAHLFCMTLGTGVGGALMCGGRLHRGTSGSAGEVGHMTMLPRGPRCGCGNHGCLESLIGTAAILRRGRAALRGGSGLLRRAVESAGALTPEVISQAARAGDASARKIWDEAGMWLGLGLANVVNLFNPDRIVIGGGIAAAWPLFAPSMKRTLRARAMSVPGRAVRVVRATLGDQAGIVGGAVLVRQEATGNGRRSTSFNAG